MSDIIKELAKKAEANLAKAQETILGFRSGPGIDISVRATKPVTGDRTLTPITNAGQAFIHQFYPSRTIPVSEIHKFARLASEWGISFVTIWETEEL